ncbi:hypothetical protein GCM10025881_16300 [Pseudolysinimonas kribbensis]|uniref:Uncharacterized protein n=1 Tax=Pseudolysinimonas kribbensis TaxID=433641 RepID=A0ABQ6K7T3_9MICO|nr:hypothetical protein GCM10025881_16300 [Pseudolysinimonas kribbensis]
MHGAHCAYQKLTTTTSPRSSELDTVPPVDVVAVKLIGAVRLPGAITRVVPSPEV